MIFWALLFLPTPAQAEVCDKERPNWTGTPATPLDEALHLFTQPIPLTLLAATALAALLISPALVSRASQVRGLAVPTQGGGSPIHLQDFFCTFWIGNIFVLREHFQILG